MSFGGFYDTGTVSITGAAVTGTGTLWAVAQIEQGDDLCVGGATYPIDSVTDDLNIVLAVSIIGSPVVDSTYIIKKTSWLRYDPALVQEKLRSLLASVQATAIMYAVTGTVPDVGLGEDGQYALKTNAGAWQQWLKVAGEWVLQSTPVGTNNRGPWDSATSYVINDITTSAGKGYIANTSSLNKTPASNPTEWSLIADKGDTGATGATGLSILNGSGAPSNATGQNGEFYFDTTNKYFYGPKVAGAWGSGFSVVGAQGGIGPTGNTGDAGIDGATVLSGSGAPSNSLGANGDYYIAVDIKYLYGPKASGAWPTGVSIIGPQGIQGVQGQGTNYDASGTLAQRDTYDGQTTGFAYLQTDVAPFRLWVKASNTTSDWAGPTYIGGAAAVGDLGSVADSILETFDYGVAA